MIVVTKRGLWRWLVYLAIALGILLLYSFYWKAEEAKADRSNAVQVAAVAEVAEAEPPLQADFFTEYRLERDKLRSERSELLRENLKSAATEESRRAAQESILALAREKERETEMESLIRAKGFADALVFCRAQSVSAVVKAPSLTQAEAAQVADVICRLGGVRQEDVTVSIAR